MSDEQKPGDPADKAADGAFGGVQSHRAGYGDDKLARVIDWLRAHPTTTLASGEGALLLGEIDRLRARCRQIDDEAYDYAEQIEQLKAAAKDSADHYTDARAEINRLTRILGELLEPSEVVMRQMRETWLNAAVAAAEQEVGYE